MTSPVVVWINESAGSGLGQRWGERTLSTLRAAGVAAVPIIATDPVDATAQVRAELAAGARALICVGGDGTVHYGLQVIAGTDVSFGIVPAGSGDDIARAAGMVQSDPTRCLAQIVRGLAMAQHDLPQIDLGRARSLPHADGSIDRWFGATLYAGFDARVNARANGMSWPPGRARYPVAMLAELATFAPSPFVVTLDDGTTWQQDACVAVVANGSSYGGGMQVVPHARVDDDTLDLMLLAGVSRTELLKVFPRVYRGTHGAHPAVTFHRSRSIKLESPGLDAWADGEHIGPLPLTIEAVPRALTLLRPPVPAGS